MNHEFFGDIPEPILDRNPQIGGGLKRADASRFAVRAGVMGMLKKSEKVPNSFQKRQLAFIPNMLFFATAGKMRARNHAQVPALGGHLR